MKIAKCKIQVSLPLFLPLDGGGKGGGELRKKVAHESRLWVRDILIAFICFFFIISSCAKTISEEDKLKSIVNEVAEAAQKKDIDGIRKHISKSYKDQEGNDYDSVRRILLYHFIRAETVS